LQKRFGDLSIISGLDLELADREFTVLVGPSGCGKSTTLRMIAGLEEINDGEIWIGDRVVSRLEPKDRDIAMVFQNYALYPHMSVAKNMSFALLYALSGSTEARRAGQARRRDTRPDEAAGASPVRPVRRPAPARRDRPRAGARSPQSFCSTSRSPISTRKLAPRCALEIKR
jgi:ABC-type sugar transport system ATPase subunit